MNPHPNLIAVVGLGLLLAGCTGTPGNPTPAPTPSAFSTLSPGASSSEAVTLPATTTIPAPSGTAAPTSSRPSASYSVDPGGQTLAPAVPTSQPQGSGGVEARVLGLEAIIAQAGGPGEVSGPALAVTVQVTNASKADVNLSGILVMLYDSRQDPGGEMIRASSPMKGVLAPGGTAKGTYVFTIPTDRRRPVTIQVTLPTDAPVLVFTADAPTG